MPTRAKQVYDDLPTMVESKAKWFSFFHQDNGCSFTTRLSAAPLFYYQKKQPRNEYGGLKMLRREHEDKYGTVSVKIIAATLEQDDRTEKQVYPGPSEEIILEVLKKMAMDQRGECLDDFLTVRFYIRDIQRELEKIGRKKSHQEIVDSLSILRRASYIIEGTNMKRYEESFITTLALEEREDSKDRKTIVCFSRAIVDEIKATRYRLIDYETAIRLPTLGRKLLDRIVYHFKQLDKESSYDFLLSEFLESLGMSMRSRPRDSQSDMNKALDLITIRSREKLQEDIKKAFKEENLKEFKRLTKKLVRLKKRSKNMKMKFQSYTVKPIKEGRKVVDYRYKLNPTRGFVTEAVKTNWIQRQIRFKLR